MRTTKYLATGSDKLDESLCRLNRGSDLERSSFQNKPAYRYLRDSDHLPTMAQLQESGAMDHDPMVRVKLFNPTGAGTWWIAAYDPENRVAYGRADIFGDGGEVGPFFMPELVEFRGRFGLPIERDLHFAPCKLSECAR